MKKKTELYRSDWNGVLLEIVYEPLWMPGHVAGEDLAHIEVRRYCNAALYRPPEKAVREAVSGVEEAHLQQHNTENDDEILHWSRYIP